MSTELWHEHEKSRRHVVAVAIAGQRSDVEAKRAAAADADDERHDAAYEVLELQRLMAAKRAECPLCEWCFGDPA